MKHTLKKAFVSFAAVLALGSVVAPLAASAQEEGELGTEFKATYLSDPSTLDYIFTQRQTNSMHAVNFVEGLYENDQYGNYIPAAAESHEVSEDGLTYTYKIRPGIKWVDMNGNEYAETTAHDWVAGLKHAVDVQSELLPIVAESIAGLADYINGDITDFEEVGVKALDDYTLQYTLTRPEPYFNSKTTYGILYPVNQEFLDAVGEDFGSLSPDSILYNGPFILTNLTAKSQIEYIKNEAYWDKDNVHLDLVQYTYNDGSDPEVYYRLFRDGAVSSFRVDPTLPIYGDVQKEYEGYITQQQRTGTAFMVQFNLNRIKHEATGKESDKQHEDTRQALLNKKFRQAIMFGFNRHTYLSQRYGEEFAEADMRNTLVPPEFVNIGDQTFGEVVAEELEALNPDLYAGVDLSDGQDAFYDPEKASALFAEAKEELEGEGVEFPIQIDFPVLESVPLDVNNAKSFKSSIEDALGAENVQVNIVLLAQDPYYAATYYATVASEVDYDITSASGWSPDYLDPSSYLDIYGPVDGSFIVNIGFDPILREGAEDPYAEAREATGLYEYQKLIDEAASITDDLDARFAAYAKAQAYLTDEAISLPVYTGGSSLRVTKVVPFSGPYAYAGSGSDKFKYVKVQQEPVSYEQWEAAYEDWAANKISGSSISSNANDGEEDSEETSEESVNEDESSEEAAE